MNEVYILDANGQQDALCFPGLANSSTQTAGMLYAVVVGTKSTAIENGVLTLGTASSSAPGLFAGLKDSDGYYYPTINEAATVLPVCAKKVKDIDKKVWTLAELKNKGNWQAATVAKCVLPDGTPLFLKIHTEGDGEILLFELTTSEYYT
jgi:hypothetical protein